MKAAFAAPVSLPSRTEPVLQRACTTRMCARIPGDESAAPSKYSQYISASRLNKAPLIQLNSFPNQDFNNITVSLVDMHTDIAAAESLRGREDSRVSRESAPDPSLYAKYYDPETVNRAPFVSIAGSAKNINGSAVAVGMYDVPLQVNVPQAILDQAPAEDVSRAYMKLPPTAPEIQIFERNDGEPNSVYIENAEQHLNLVAAQTILNKYRK